jgi:replication factor A1
MQIKDLHAKQGEVELTAEVIDKANPREFDKFGKKGKVCNAKIKDETGTVTLTLWNEDADTINVGDTIKIVNGYVGEWQGELQLSAGKFGKIDVVKKAEPKVLKNFDEPVVNSEDLDEDEDLDVEEEDVSD